MKVDIVLGCLFGDEGKGQTVNSLATPESLVIRFSGGHQCGHTVVTGTNQHTFSQLGAGTFKGSATYITDYCTVYPKGFIKELDSFYKQNPYYMGKKILDRYFVSPLAMVTTPYDVAFNKIMDGITKHGTTGTGFGTTIERNENNITLYASELKIPLIYDHKMNQIGKYYRDKVQLLDMDSQIRYEELLRDEFDEFEDWDFCIDSYKSNVKMEIIKHYNHLIFEGSQGIMLDQKFGLFPHVTRSNTTALNAMEMINKRIINKSIDNNLTVHYVTRAYMTRHGNGPFVSENNPLSKIDIFNNEHETNKENDWQGKFRIAPMNFNLLRHAIEINNDIMSSFGMPYKTKLLVTCCDQISNNNFYTTHSSFMSMPVDEVKYCYERDWF